MKTTDIKEITLRTLRRLTDAQLAALTVEQLRTHLSHLEVRRDDPPEGAPQTHSRQIARVLSELARRLVRS